MNGDGKQDILVSKIESQIVPPPSISSNLFAYTGPPYNGRTFIQSGADGSVIAELVNPALSSSQIMDFNFGHKVGSAGDVNGDGTKDLFVLGFRVESVQLNTYSQPTPNRIAKILLYSGIAPYSLIYSIDYNDLPATPTGSYATPLNSWVASIPSFLDLGDVNADGKADIAISFDSSPNNNVIHILSGANKAHIRSITFGTGGIMRHVAGDINNDGVNDILTALVAPSGSQYPNNIIIFSGVDGNILRQRAYPSSYSSINYLNDNIITAAVGDFNNDNYDDVLIFNEIRSGLDDSLLFTFNLPTTSSFSLAQLALSPDAGRRTAKEFMDVNGDGKFDFIFSSINSYFFAISGVDNSFIFNFVNTGSSIDYGLVKGGANVDSDPATEFTLFNRQTGTFLVFDYAGVPPANLVLPPQNGRILTPDCTPTNLNSYYLQTRDFISLKDINNDGREDYAISTFRNSGGNINRLELYSGATRQLISTINSPISSPSSSFAIKDVAVADVNGDGDKEIVVSQVLLSYGAAPYSNLGGVLVYDNILGQPTLLYTLTGLATDYGFGFSIAVGDFDNDAQNKDDIIVGIPYAPPNYRGRAAVYRGNDGVLIYAINPGPGHRGFGAGVGVIPDINNDGRDEFLTFSNYLTSVQLYMIGQYTLYVPQSAVDVDYLSVSTSGDLSGDGINDILFDARNVLSAGVVGANPSALVISGPSGVQLNRFPLGASRNKLRTIRDVNLDNIPDILSLYENIIYSGMSGERLLSFPLTNYIFLGTFGDTNNDGFDDLAVGKVYPPPNQYLRVITPVPFTTAGAFRYGLYGASTPTKQTLTLEWVPASTGAPQNGILRVTGATPNSFVHVIAARRPSMDLFPDDEKALYLDFTTLVGSAIPVVTNAQGIATYPTSLFRESSSEFVETIYFQATQDVSANDVRSSNGIAITRDNLQSPTLVQAPNGVLRVLTKADDNCAIPATPENVALCASVSTASDTFQVYSNNQLVYTLPENGGQDVFILPSNVVVPLPNPPASGDIALPLRYGGSTDHSFAAFVMQNQRANGEVIQEWRVRAGAIVRQENLQPIVVLEPGQRLVFLAGPSNQQQGNHFTAVRYPA